MSTLDELAAAMDNHQVTDDQGQITEETTSEENTAAPDQTTVEEGATAEKSAGVDKSSPDEEPANENEPDLVETASDETGKRYVPEARFKEVYAKWKAAEREKGQKPTPLPTMPVAQTPANKADALEVELLMSTLPQFNPSNPDYNEALDNMGFDIYEASKDKSGDHTITRLEAARRAISRASKITSKVVEAKTEARTVKAQQSDQGITSRVLNREGVQVNPEKMTLEEKEEWLKANGYW